MADDRADPIMDNYDPDGEAHMFGIINGDILYVPTGQEEDDISSYLNLDGGTEIVDDQEGEGTDIVDGGQPSTTDDLELQVATTSGEVYIYIEPLVIQTYLNVLTRATLFLFFSPWPDRVRQSVANPRR